MPSDNPIANQFYSKTVPIYAAIQEINPTYKQTFGSAVYEFVVRAIGQELAPKITGMLMDLPIGELRIFCVNFDLFLQRIQEAHALLTQ
jgi:hypothetical protein